MASSFNFYTGHFETLNTGLETYWTGVAGSFASYLLGPARMMLLIYVALWGWSMMRGVIQEPFVDGAMRMLRLASIVLIALNVGRYAGFLANMLWGLPDALAAKVAADSTGTDGVQFLDAMMGQFYDMGTAFNRAANADTGIWGMPDMSLWIAGIAVWCVGIILTGYAAFLYVLAKVALALLLGVGPIFILLLIFEPTKKFFDAWLGQCANYIVMVLLTAGCVKLILSILSTYLGDPRVVAAMADPKINQVIPVIAFSIIGVLVMLQVPSLASGLGGGVATGTLGAMAAAFSKAKSAAGAGRDLVSGKTLSDMRGRRRAAATNARWAKNNPSMPASLYRKVTSRGKNSVSAG